MAEKVAFANLTEESDKLYEKKSFKELFYPLAYELINHAKHMSRGIMIAKFLRFITTFYLLVDMSMRINLDNWLLTPLNLLLTYTNIDFFYNGLESGTIQIVITALLSFYFLFSLIVFFALSYFKPDSKKHLVWYKYFAFNLVIVAPVLSAWANISFLNEVSCDGRASMSECLESPYVYGWSFALAGLIYELLLNVIIWNFMYIDSEVLSYSLNGRSKFVTILNEIERKLITLFSVSLFVNQYQQTLMVALVALFCLKLFFRLRKIQYFDYKLSKFCLFLDTMILTLVLMNILIYIDRVSMSSESIFLGFCLAGLIISYYVVYFYTTYMINRFKWNNDQIIDGKTFQKQVSNFLMLINNYKTSTQMRLKLWNFMHQHKIKCTRQSCICHDIPLEHITSGLGEYLVDRGLYEFLADKIKTYIDNQELRMDLQLSCSMILLMKLKRFNAVTHMMKQVKGMKATSSQTFEIFILE